MGFDPNDPTAPMPGWGSEVIETQGEPVGDGSICSPVTNPLQRAIASYEDQAEAWFQAGFILKGYKSDRTYLVRDQLKKAGLKWHALREYWVAVDNAMLATGHAIVHARYAGPAPQTASAGQSFQPLHEEPTDSLLDVTVPAPGQGLAPLQGTFPTSPKSNGAKRKRQAQQAARTPEQQAHEEAKERGRRERCGGLPTSMLIEELIARGIMQEAAPTFAEAMANRPPSKEQVAALFAELDGAFE